MKTCLHILLCALAFGAFTACKEKVRPKTTGEKVEIKVKDGFDTRPNENVKDVAEDALKK
ncbi:MAG: hypothetical protein JWR15_1307 [Prosthecobacter sp.]|nr:hypothetical protein [Prosthecobacter sp.]